MRTCLECQSDISNKSNKIKFCSVKCSNVYNGKLKFNLNLNSGKFKICLECKKEKPSTQFSYNKKGDVKSGKKEICKQCGANKREILRRNKSWKDDAARVLLNNSKQRAKKSNIEHTLKYEDIKIPEICPVLGIPLKREDKSTWMNAPSIDRIDNTKGYVYDNIIVVSRRADILKKDASINELILLAEFYKQFESI